MNLWIPALCFAAFIAFTIVRAVRDGRREGARLERVFADLASRRCPACAQPYGPPRPDLPYVTFMPDPDFDDPAYQNWWKVRCPACHHTIIAGLAKDAEILVLHHPAESGKPAENQ